MNLHVRALQSINVGYSALMAPICFLPTDARVQLQSRSLPSFLNGLLLNKLKRQKNQDEQTMHDRLKSLGRPRQLLKKKLKQMRRLVKEMSQKAAMMELLRMDKKNKVKLLKKNRLKVKKLLMNGLFAQRLLIHVLMTSTLTVLPVHASILLNVAMLLAPTVKI